MSTVSPPNTNQRLPVFLSPRFATVLIPSKPLLELDSGTPLSATVLQASGDGHFEVRTEFGSFAIHTQTPLTKNMHLDCTVVKSAKAVQLIFLKIDGEPASQVRSPPANEPTEKTLSDRPNAYISKDPHIDPIDVSTSQMPPNFLLPRFATVLIPSKPLLELDSGTPLTATVLQTSGDGYFEVRTEFGSFAIHTQTPLTKNTSLDCTVVKSAKAVQLIFLKIDGEPASQVRSPTTNEPTETTLSDRPNAYISKDPHIDPIDTSKNSGKLGASHKKDNFNSSNLNPASGPGMMNKLFETESILSRKIIGVVTSKLYDLKQLLSNKSEFVLKSYFEPGQEISASILHITPPGETSSHLRQVSKLAIAKTKSILAGTIYSTPTGNHQVIETEIGTFSIRTNCNLLPKTQILLELLVDEQSQSLLESEQLNSFSSTNSVKWQGMNDMISALETAAPTAYHQMLQSVMPQPNSHLAKNLFLFLAGLKKGNIKEWTGDGPIRILEHLNPLLALRVQNYFSTMITQVDEPSFSEWKIYSLPFLADNDVELIRFMVRHSDPDEKNIAQDAASEKDSRFIIEMNFSQLGRIQLDGFFKKHRKKVDLIIRSDQNLSQEVREKIQEILIELEKTTTFHSSLTFLSQPADFFEFQKTNTKTAVGISV